MDITIINIIAGILGTIAGVAVVCTYYYGYYRGYKEGLDYGQKGLEDYHKHVMNSIKTL